MAAGKSIMGAQVTINRCLTKYIMVQPLTECSFPTIPKSRNFSKPKTLSYTYGITKLAAKPKTVIIFKKILFSR